MPSYKINVIFNSANVAAGMKIIRDKLKEAGDQASKVNETFKQTTNTTSRLRSAFQRTFDLLAIGFAVQQIVQFSDSMTLLANRLSSVTSAGEKSSVIIADLYKVAQNTRSSFEGIGEVYTRVRLATQNMGLAHKDAIRFVDLLSKTVALSGASSIEARNALIQLSQGLASGTLRGDELRSVMEQLPAVAGIIAKQFGITTGELRILGEQGKISAKQVYEAFMNASAEIDAAFAKTVPTIAQAFTMLTNAITYTIYQFNRGSGVFSYFAEIIAFVARNFQFLVAALAPILAGVVASAFLGMANAIYATAKAMGLLNFALLNSPLVRIATLITTLVAQFVYFREEIAAAIAYLLNFFGIFDTIDKAVEAVSFVLERVVFVIYKLIDGLLSLFGLTRQATPEAASGFGSMADSTEKFNDEIEKANKNTRDFGNYANYAGNAGRSAWGSIDDSVISTTQSISYATGSMQQFTIAAYEAADAVNSIDTRGFYDSGFKSAMGSLAGTKGTFGGAEGFELKSAGVGSYGLTANFGPSAESLDKAKEYYDLIAKGDTQSLYDAYSSVADDLALANTLASQLPGTEGFGSGEKLQEGAKAQLAVLAAQLDKEKAAKTAKDAKATKAAKSKKSAANVSSSRTTNVTIVTPDVNSFAQSQSQMMTKLKTSFAGA